MAIPATHDDPLILSGTALLVNSDQLVPNGALAMARGTIQGVGTRDQILRQFSGVPEVHAAGCILSPGFVNAHTHLELTYIAGTIPGQTSFPDWVLRLIEHYPEPADAQRVFTASALRGAQESLFFGVTTVGDITRRPSIVRTALQLHSALRVVSFGEIAALGKLRGQLDERLTAALTPPAGAARMRIGLSPHAPYSVEGPVLETIARAARNYKLPLCMHLAELREEKEFLTDFSGPLGKEWSLMQRLNLLDDLIPAFAEGPIRWAEHYGLFSAGVPVILAHVNYADDAEIDLLARCGAAVAYCPRTRDYFGHDAITPHRWRDMRAHGIRVCLATDSKASNPDLSPLREAQCVLQRDPTADPQNLMAMITTEPAIALGLKNNLGQLATGFSADVIAIPVPANMALNAARICDYLVRHAPQPSQVWVGGQSALDRQTM